jgi:HEAT repeat protein
MLHANLAEDNGVQSVPTLLVGQDLRYVGNLDRNKLVSVLRSADPASLLQERIRNQILEGKALEAAAWIAQGGDPSFLASDLGKSTFAERLALLLALEQALEADPRCLDRLVAPLLPYLETADASIRGDIADLLGKIGDARALPALNRLCSDADPNVADAAAEATQAIHAGHRQAAE